MIIIVTRNQFYIINHDSSQRRDLGCFLQSSRFRVFRRDRFCFLNKKYVVDSKNFYHYFDEPNVMDVNLIAYLSGLSLIEWRNHVTNTHEQMYRQYRDVKNCNHLIPLSKHLERVENLFEDVSRMLGQANFNKECYEWYNLKAIKTYSDLEESYNDQW